MGQVIAVITLRLNMEIVKYIGPYRFLPLLGLNSLL